MINDTRSHAGRPLWTLLNRRDEFDRPDLPLLTVVSEHGVRVRDLSDGRTPSEDLAGYRVVHDGDLVVNKMWARFGAYGVADRSGIISPAYWVLRSQAGVVEPRFLHHLLRSTPYRAEIWRRSKDLPPNGFDLPWEQFRTITVSLPPLDAQRAIADYLDRETARIDALIAAMGLMMDLQEERVAVAFDHAVCQRGVELPDDLDPDWVRRPPPKGWSIMHLSQALVQLTNGFVGPTRDILVDDGVPYVQSLHIKNGRIDFARRPFYVTRTWHDERPRIHLRADDVLIVQTGDIGQVAVVPTGFGAASCHALQIARVRRDVVSGHYLAAFLRSSFGRQSLLSRATGALHPHLEAGIKDIPVVVPPLAVQDVVVEEVDETQRRATKLISVLDRQTKLLHERRQAVIAAAVTGQLDIPEAA